MAKNFRKLLLGLTAVSAAGAGIYYWMKKNNGEEPEDDLDDDFENDDFELDDDLGEVKERGYVNLTPPTEAPSEESGSENTGTEPAVSEAVTSETESSEDKTEEIPADTAETKEESACEANDIKESSADS